MLKKSVQYISVKSESVEQLFLIYILRIDI